MKRFICLTMALLVSLLALGCSDKAIGEQSETKQEIIEDELSSSFELTSEIDNDIDLSGNIENSEVKQQEKADDSGVEVDLTVLSSTMVYSEVYNMMIEPENYIGKTVKMEGQFVPYYDESTGNYYFACFISDATACCSQGIEFVLTDEYSYPDDYPKEGDTICVVGTFDTYMEGKSMYCTLRNAILV